MNEELKVGDFITVVKWLSHYDRSYVGDCLEVKAKDGEFLRVFRHKGYCEELITLNLKEIVVRRLSNSFIETFLPERKNPFAADLVPVNPFKDLKVDDKILVWDEGITTKQKRHFAGLSKTGRVLAFPNGTTSFSCPFHRNPMEWTYCEPYKESE